MEGWRLALPLLIGFFMDALIGDPYTLPHPVRAMGRLIAAMERRLYKNAGGAADVEADALAMKKANGAEEEEQTGKEKLDKKEQEKQQFCGILLVLCVLFLSTVPVCALLWFCYRIHFVLGIAAESILCCYMLAARCLRDESMKVYHALKVEEIEKARAAVSMIVGRDTKILDMQGIARAAVETVAESTSDGVTAPLFFMAFGGAGAAFFYKAANTMDSMIGYKNMRYRYFGWAAARLDDVLNFIPSRLTALCMIVAAFLCGLDGKNAWRIWRRDRRKHASPNSAQTESVCAGALGVELAGDAYYGGVLLHKPKIGDAKRQIEAKDIRRANRLMYVSAGIMLAAAAAVRTVLFVVFL